MRAALSSVRMFGERGLAGLVLAAPGLLLFALYAQRLLAFREDPSAAPGTPAETVIALMVAGVAFASVWLGLEAGRGRVHRPVGAAGFMCLACVVFVMTTAFVHVPS